MTSTRRSFLGASAALASGLGLGCRAAAQRQADAAKAPRDKMRLMVVGVANRAAANLNGVAGEEVVVLCDVDRRYLDKAAERFPNALKVADYREILGDPAKIKELRLDGVVVSTPDHTHYLPSMLALQNGLHVYCEKPLTQSVAQARRLLEAAQKHHCTTQMGIQIHANENFRRVVEAVRAGAVGTVREVVVFVNGTNWSATELPKSEPTPDFLSWHEWLGPTAEREFSPGYHPASWRRYWAFGGGTTADMACHYMDLAFWALELDAPTSLQADGPEPDPECAPAAMRCEYAFPARGARPALTLHWHAAGDRPEEKLKARGLEKWTNGVLYIGDQGWLISNYDKHELGRDEGAPAWTAPDKSIPPSPGHYKEWIDCAAAGTQPTCSFEYAVPLTETVLLANAAYRGARGKRITWDRQAMKTNSDAVNKLLDITPRKGFDA
ncbi:MAG: Gfo/Idh/MocA family oxidoreductase [Planctomycetota bacterium]